jgi:hypothetical protein
MIAADIVQAIRHQISDDLDISLKSEGRIEVFTPFMYQDGDHCGFYFNRNENGQWEATDEGEVLGHAGYSGVDLLDDGRAEKFRKAVEFFGMHERGGELILPVSDETKFGEAFFRFAQACMDILNLTKLPAARRGRESSIRDQVASIITKARIPSAHVVRKWHHPDLDPDRVYGVDFFIKGKSLNLLVHAVKAELACLRAAVASLHYRQTSFPFHGIAIYDDESELPRKAAVSLSEAVDATFSAGADEEEIVEYLAEKAAA